MASVICMFSSCNELYVDILTCPQAGGYIRDDIVSDIIQFISQTTEYQSVAVQQLYTALTHDIITVS